MSDEEKIIPLFPDKHEPEMTELAPGALDNSFLHEEPEEEQQEEKEELPTALQRRMISSFVFAGLLTAGSIILAFYFKELRFLIGVLIALYLAYLGYSVKRDYEKGNIIEALLICSSVQTRAMSKNAKLIFRTDDEIPDYYKFIVPRKWADDFTPNVMYLIYFNAHTPNLILGYEQL